MTAPLLSALDGRDTPPKRWIRAHLDYPHADRCLIWPFSRTPGKFAAIGKRQTRVHRIMCEYRNGPAPEDRPQAAHSCGKGHDGCVSPLHLSWKNNSENQLERYKHSGPTKRAKLTLAQVEEIRALKGTATPMVIATQFGVSEVNIRGILTGKLWKSTSNAYTVEQDQIIRDAISRGLNFAQIGKLLGKPTHCASARAYRLGLKSGRPIIKITDRPGFSFPGSALTRPEHSP